MAKQYWLLKTEPGAFSIDDLASAPGRTSPWDGVRNYQARNFMRDAMALGDGVLLYHSVRNPGIVGLAEVVREGYPDHTALDEKGEHFDPRHSQERPIWYMVDVRLVEKFITALPLALLRTVSGLAGMELLRKGSRLSVQPVRPGEYDTVVALAHERQALGL